ncbi:MAG: sterol desaturase [Bacteroidia bacterium]|nr:MAG: sterol desaturase [Bacteroidia bacterium]
MNPNLPILLAIPFFLIAIAIELWFQKKQNKKWYRLNDAITNLNIGIGNQVFSLFIKAILLWSYAYTLNAFAIFRLENTWYNFLIGLLIFDFLFYWAHRWSHEVNFLWGAHVVHHSSEEYNLTVALRQSWIHNLIAFFIFLPMPLLGFHPQTFIMVASIHTLYQFWIHTKAIGKLHPWIEFWFNTPSHHRVHHGVNPQYIDKNHGGILIIWDRLFGTFELEQEEVKYGITRSLESWNPAWANWHYYQEMWHKIKKAPHWWLKLKVFFARPGWDPLSDSIPPYSVDLQRNIFDTPLQKPFRNYILVQFALSVIALCAFMWFYNELSDFFKISNALLILLTGVICGGILENKKWVTNAEYLRLALVVSNLNVMYYRHFPHWFVVTLILSLIGFFIFIAWFYRNSQWFNQPRTQ